MAAILNDDLVRALDAQGNAPLPMIHPVTGKTFFLVSGDCYERLRALFEDVKISIDEQRFHLQEAGRRAGWDESSMDAYDRYDELRSQAKP